MGLASRKDLLADTGVTKKTSQVDVVFSEDDDVKAVLDERYKGCGWILREHAPGHGPDAWILTVRGLDDDSEWPQFRSIRERMGPAGASPAAVHTCLVRMEMREDGKRIVIAGMKQLKPVVATLSKLGPEGREGLYLDLLRDTIVALSLGRSVESCYADARAQLGYDPYVEAEGGSDGAASKSGEG